MLNYSLSNSTLIRKSLFHNYLFWLQISIPTVKVQSMGKESPAQDLWRKMSKWNVGKKDKSRSEGIIWRIRHSHSHKIITAPMAGACRKISGRQITEDGEAENNWRQEKEMKAEIEMVEWSKKRFSGSKNQRMERESSK